MTEAARNPRIGRDAQIGTETWFELSGTSMRVLQSGRGEAVLLAHSYLWDASMWQAQISALSKTYHVIAPCLWGHGGSGPMPEGTQDLRDIARHHLAMLDSLGIPSVSVIGHSLGGMWGAELALIAPERVRSIALVDTCLEAEPEPARLRYFAMLDAVAAARAVPPPIARQVAAMFFAPDMLVLAPAMLRDCEAMLADWPTERLADSVVPLGRMTFGRRNSLDEFSRLGMPKLVIHGAEDIPRPFEEGRRMAELLDCDIIPVPGAGHMAPLEVPDVVSGALLDFLQSVHRPEMRLW
jgi:pimeloyl-ACP methyl ester carboxylesterase